MNWNCAYLGRSTKLRWGELELWIPGVINICNIMDLGKLWNHSNGTWEPAIGFQSALRNFNDQKMTWKLFDNFGMIFSTP